MHSSLIVTSDGAYDYESLLACAWRWHDSSVSSVNLWNAERSIENVLMLVKSWEILCNVFIVVPNCSFCETTYQSETSTTWANSD